MAFERLLTANLALCEKRRHLPLCHHRFHRFIRRTLLEAAGGIQYLGKQANISRRVQKCARMSQHPMHRPINVGLFLQQLVPPQSAGVPTLVSTVAGSTDPDTRSTALPLPAHRRCLTENPGRRKSRSRWHWPYARNTTAPFRQGAMGHRVESPQRIKLAEERSRIPGWDTGACTCRKSRYVQQRTVPGPRAHGWPQPLPNRPGLSSPGAQSACGYRSLP